jgi:hypothetical protein
LPTFVPLPLDLNVFGQILILLPFDISSNSVIVHKVAAIADLILVQVFFRKDRILEVFVRGECEEELEALG